MAKLKVTSEIAKYDLKSAGIDQSGLAYDNLAELYRQRGPLMEVPHRHDYYEVIWFTEGKGVHYVEFAGYEIKPNTLFFLARNQIHFYKQYSVLKGHLLRFDDTFMRPQAKGGLGSLEFSVFKRNALPYRTLTEDQPQRFTVLLRQIRNEVSSLETHRHGELLALLLRVFLIEAERLGQPEEKIQPERLEMLTIFYAFVSLLETHYQEHLSVQQYAKKLGLSSKRVTDICRSVAGISTKKIIDERLVLEAKRYLLHSSFSIKEIGFMLGFDDPAHFSKFFKNNVNLYPLNFRNRAS